MEKLFFDQIGSVRWLVKIVVVGLVCLWASQLSFGDSPAVPAGSDPAVTSSDSTAVSTGTPATAPVANVPPQQGLGQMLPFMAILFVLMYFLMIRPQNKKLKEQQEILKGLKHGDEVVTQSGFLGKITGITDKIVTLEISNNVRVKMLKSQVVQIVKGQIKDLA